MSERGVRRDVFALLQKTVESCIDLGLILKIAGESGPLACSSPAVFRKGDEGAFPGVRVGYAWDEAFSFYYRDALDYLEYLGASLVSFSPLHDRELPEKLDGILIGGGFPELYARELSQNRDMLRSIREFVRRGRPAYAECGGLMYLAREIVTFEKERYGQVGLIPAVAVMRDKIQALGYYQGESLRDSVLGPAGTKLKGHEFHYSSMVCEEDFPFACRLYSSRKPARAEGYCSGSIYASYLHQHWVGSPQVAGAFLKACLAASGLYPKCTHSAATPVSP
jgi:cobyrinic acid a,c-diamide synthase